MDERPSRAVLEPLLARLEALPDRPDKAEAIAKVRAQLDALPGESASKGHLTPLDQWPAMVADLLKGDGPGGSEERLDRYWTEGEGGGKIAWGSPGDFDRCVLELGKYIHDDHEVKGHCARLHHRALGIWPATHAAEERGKGFEPDWVKAFNPDQPRDSHGRWIGVGALVDGAKDSLSRHTGTDGQLAPARQGLHDRIVNDALAGHTRSPHPTATFLGGGPASGKSTALGSLLAGKNDLRIDSDAIKEKIPEYRAMVAAHDPRAAAFNHEESSHLANRIRQEATKRGYDFTLDGTGDSGLAKMRKKVEDAHQHGYQVHAAYATVDTDEAVRRANKRAERTGRVVPESVIRAIHQSTTDTFRDAINTNLFDSAELWDNTSKPPVLVGRKAVGGEWTVNDPGAWQRFLAKGTPAQKAQVEMALGEAAIRLLTAATNGQSFAQSGVPDTPQFRDLWNQIGDELDLLGDHEIVHVPSDPNMLDTTADKGFNPLQPRDDHGRFSSAGGLSRAGAKKIIGHTVREGGHTVHPASGHVPHDGFMVGQKGKDRVVDAKDFFGPKGPEILRSYVKSHAEDFQDPNTHLGTWHDPESGKVFLDTSKRYTNQDEAVAAGRAQDQIAIFDLGSKTEIPTGGTGGLE